MIECPAGRIDYGEQGSGPAIAEQARCYRAKAIPYEGDHTTPYRSRTPRAGHERIVGTKERRTSDDASIEREVDVIETVIQRTNGAVHLVGHSYGG